LSEYRHLDASTIEHIRSHADVPLWFPDPIPPGWTLAGLAAVGDARSRLRATVAAFRGPAPLGGDGEWLFVAEEPGIGLGAGYAGVDPPETTDALPSAKIAIRGHPLPIWPVPGTAADRSAYRGEAAGVWLWLIGLPSDAGYAVLDDLGVSDTSIRPVLAAETAQRSRRLRPGWAEPPA
jgi:hypothetical protein